MAKKITAKGRYAEFPPRNFGHKCPHYRNYHIIQILTYYNIKHAGRSTKKQLLTYLLTAERMIEEPGRNAIQAWMNQWPEPRQRFSEFIDPPKPRTVKKEYAPRDSDDLREDDTP